jgi:hypothetical protein
VPSSGPITVTVLLAPGLTYASGGGSGWSCGVSGQEVSCLSSDAIAPGAASSIPLTVMVGVASYPGATTVAVVSHSGDANQCNNTAGDPVAVGRVWPAGVVPASGSAASQTFTFTFTHPEGYQNLGVVNVLINDFLDGRYACYLAYHQPSNVLYLVNDPGTALLPGLVLNGSGSVGNSQCTVNGTGSSAAGNGTVLTLTLNVTFGAGLSGERVIYLAARDVGETLNSGWHALGVWRVPGGAAGNPSVGGVTPARVEGLRQQFTVTFSDTAGYTDLGVVNVLINDFLNGDYACHVAYSQPLGVLYLVNDQGPGSGLSPGLVLGTAGTVSNSQCTIYGATSSAVGSGNTLTLVLDIGMKAGFAGNRVIYGAARTVAEANSGWRAIGTWTVP